MAPINLDKPLNTLAADENLVVLFVVLQTIGFLGSSVVLATALLGKSVKRDGTWINFAVSWVVSPLTYLILFITGQQFQTTPIWAVCMTQAALVYASPVLTALTAVALALQLMYRIRWALGKSSKGEGLTRIKQHWFIVIPWIAFVLVLIEAFIVSGLFPSSVRVESGMYCGVTNGIPGRVTATIVVLSMAVLIGVEIGALKQLYPVWSSFDREAQKSGNSSPRAMVLRLGIFSLLALISVVVGFAVISEVGAAQDPANITLSLLPIAFTLIFGIQKDILNTWAFWKRSSQPPLPPPKDFKDASQAAERPTRSFSRESFA